MLKNSVSLKNNKNLDIILYFILALTCFNPTLSHALAFPGAEGFGAVTEGGRGGAVIKVTNTNDSGPGSLRAALTTPGRRTVVFTVGGTINLNSAITVQGQNLSYLTIAGQTAPDGGIQIKGYGITFRDVHDCLIRYLKVRPGDTGGPNEWMVDKIGISLVGRDIGEAISPVYNVIVDHCDLNYSPRDNFGTYYHVYNVTVQRSIIANSIRHDNSWGGMGLLIASTASGNQTAYDATNFSIHHNLFAHNHSRNPSIRTVGNVEVINNVIYNRNFFGGEIDNKDGSGVDTSRANHANFISNYYKNGIDTITNRYDILIRSSQPNGLYVSDNIGNYRANTTLPDWNIVGDFDASPFASTSAPLWHQKTTAFPMSNFPITKQASSAIVNNVLNDVGANKRNVNVPFKDSLTQKAINDTTNNTGQVISGFGATSLNQPLSPAPTWPALATGTAPTDLDNDGMSDVWENNQFGNLGQLPNGDMDGDGYTNLEEYLNNTPAICTQTSTTPLVLNSTNTTSDGGFAYRRFANYGTLPDTGNFPVRSTLRIFENGIALNPPHSQHVDIRNLGAGRFSHSSAIDLTGEAIRFSARDNSNPLTNGKSYTYCK